MDFHAVLLEGLFYLSSEGNDLLVRTESGETLSVNERLQPLLGSNTQLAIHHVPSGEQNPNEWGWGSCRWQPAPCPAGHHLKPGFLFSFQGSGVLSRDPWRLGDQSLELEMMPGHQGRLAAASIPDVEKMKAGLAGLDPDALGLKLGELQDLLRKLKQL